MAVKADMPCTSASDSIKYGSALTPTNLFSPKLGCQSNTSRPTSYGRCKHYKDCSLPEFSKT
jgi:hypothetical protein